MGAGNQKSTSAHFAVIDVLRGVASVWVFTYHLPLAVALGAAHPWLNTLFHQGYLGVPMFFVISGFCIMAAARSTQHRQQPPRQFLKRRALRIYPPFWYAILVAVVAPFVLEGISALKTGTFLTPTLRYADYRPIDWVQTATLTRALIQQDHTQSGAFTAVNAVFWTLAIEVQFYTVMALALASRRFFSGVLVLVTILSVVAMFVPGAFTSGVFLPWWPMFALGLGLHELTRRGYTPQRSFGRQSVLVSILGVTLLLIGMGFTLRFVNGSDHSQWFCLWFGVLLWFAFGLNEVIAFRARLLPVAIALGVGEMSYSVYLVHNRLYPLSSQVVRQIISEQYLLFNVAVIALTLLVTVPFYLLCERPFIHGRNPVSRAAP